jgi:hypothetical protein
MRHIATLIAAVVIGPLAWILIAFGQDGSAAAFDKARSSGALDTGDFVRPLIYLAVAGVLVGLIATLRFSPLGAVLTGVMYVMSYVWLLIDPSALLDLFKRNLSIFGQTADPTLPVRTGTTMIVGALLLVAVVSVKRWRRWPQPATPEEPTSGLDQFGLGTDLGTGLGDTTGGLGTSGLGGTGLGSTGLGSGTSLGSGLGASGFSAGRISGSGFARDTLDETATPSGDERTSPLAGRIGTISAGSAPGQRTEPLTGSAEPTTSPSGTANQPPAGSPWTTPPRDTPENPAR